MDTLQELWKYENEPHQRDFRGWNLLHVAAGYGNFAAVPFLIERGVDLHALSDATARFVPPLLRGKCVAPGDIARGFGQEAYGKWTDAVRAAGRDVEVAPGDMDWDLEEGGGKFGNCECCDGWET
jgi:ankyrin repeat protein